MNSVPLSNGVPVILLGAMLLMQAVIVVLLAGVGAWLAIRFEKWREERSPKSN